MTIILVTGATRSGKSEWAENLAKNQPKPVIYIATAQVNPEDEQWQRRILKHQQRRPPQWQTYLCPVNLKDTLDTCPEGHCLLIDSLGTWVANLLGEKEEEWQKIQTNLLNFLKNPPQDLIFVAEETGWGVVPPYASGREFRDRLGSLIRHIGGLADQVYLVTGGYALDLRQLGQKI